MIFLPDFDNCSGVSQNFLSCPLLRNWSKSTTSVLILKNLFKVLLYKTYNNSKTKSDISSKLKADTNPNKRYIMT